VYEDLVDCFVEDVVRDAVSSWCFVCWRFHNRFSDLSSRDRFKNDWGGVLESFDVAEIWVRRCREEGVAEEIGLICYACPKLPSLRYASTGTSPHLIP